jgi:hypothetical protein
VIQSQQTKCVVDEVIYTARTVGIAPAIEKVSSLLKEYPALQNDCHAVMHRIGEETYQLYTDGVPFDVTPAITMCTYGFYHGFINSAVQKEGNFNKARDFCTYINTELSKQGIEASSECYHGFGHAVVDDHISTQFSDAHNVIQNAISLCKDLTATEDQYINCASGVYNAVANIFLERKFPWPEIDDKNSFSLCTSQPEVLQKTCYAFFARVALQSNNNDLGATINALSTMVSAERRDGIIENASNIFMLNRQDKKMFQDGIDICQTLNSEESRYCISGLAVGILQSAAPSTEFESALAVCTSTSLVEGNRIPCFRRLQYSSSLLFSKNDMKKDCQSVPELYQTEICKN